jgi:glycosyltransferase involved in cell wall biosynthesis
VKAPLVSVIVPNYQHEDFLRERLDSIFDQEFQDFELILMDDCSSDGSVRILEEYASKRPGTRLVLNEENSGSPFKQWMKGASMAQGKYLWIAESDDIALPGLLKRNVEMMTEHPKAVISFCQSIFVNERSEELYSFGENYRFVYKTDRWDADFVGDGKEECRNYMLLHNSIPNASATLIQKEAFERCGGPPLDWKLNGDWLFYCKLLQHGDIAYSAEPLNRFRKHQKTQRQRANANARAYFEILDIVAFIDAHCSPEAEKRKRAFHNYSNWWIGSLFRQERNLRYLKDNGTLYRRFRKERSYLLARIVYTAVLSSLIQLLDWLKIKPALKKIRKALFPGKYFEHE